MKNVLILDRLGQVADICRQALDDGSYRLDTTADIDSLAGDMAVFQPDLILLHADSNQSGDVWDALLDARTQDPSLPVILLFDHDRFLFDARLSQADGYVILDCFVQEDLRRRASGLLQPPRPETGVRQRRPDSNSVHGADNGPRRADGQRGSPRTASVAAPR
jgi:DNA-binding response OmpR family regulator